jgi:hypothetical protein
MVKSARENIKAASSTAAKSFEKNLKKKTGSVSSPKAVRRHSSGPSSQNIRNLLCKVGGDFRYTRITAAALDAIKQRYYDIVRHHAFAALQILYAHQARVLTQDHVIRALYQNQGKYYCGPVEAVITKKNRNKKVLEETKASSSSSSSSTPKVKAESTEPKKETKRNEEKKKIEEEDEDEDEVTV